MVLHLMRTSKRSMLEENEDEVDFKHVEFESSVRYTRQHVK